MRRAVLALAFVSAVSSSGAARAHDLADAIDRAVAPLVGADGAPGSAVAVTVEGRSAVFTYGVADKARDVPVTADTLFEIGSLSKTFTATFLAYAEALGRLSLDDRPSRFAPELAGAPIDGATIGDLATYAAGGLPLQFPEGVSDEATAYDFFRRWTPTAPPGATRRYGNPSIGLAGRLAARAVGGDFATLIETDLFARLGLRRTFIRVPEAAMDAYAWGDRDGRPIRVAPGVFDAEAYGVKSTAADLIRFVEANIRAEAFDDPLRRALLRVREGRLQVGHMTQGLGWESYAWPVALDRLLEGNSPAMALESRPAERLDPPRPSLEPRLYNKTGSTNGFGAYAAFVPERRIGVVMLMNRNVPIPARVTAAHAILEALAAEAR